MRKIYTSLLALAMTMVSMVANAQFKAELTTDPVEGFVAGYVNFDPVELATALATDTATLHAAIDAISKENAESVFYLKTADGKTNVYTGNAGEFWMNNEGAPVAYGDGNTWYCGISYDPAGSDPDSGETWSESVSISMGQMPDTFKKIYTDSKLTATAYLVIGDKEVSFEIIQNINAAPEPTLEAPVTELSKLNIVKEYTLEMPFVVGKENEGKTCTATLEGIYEALGVSQAELDASVADYVLTQTVTSTPILDEVGEATDEYIYALSDNLAQPSAASGGAWYGRYYNYDEASGEEVPLAISAPMTWGSGHNTFYTQEITLAEGVYSIVCGQYQDKLAMGDTDYTYHYIVVGDKAAKIKLQVKMEEPEKVEEVPFDQMVKVGELNLEASDYPGDYSVCNPTFDIAEVLAALGCEDATDTNIKHWNFNAEGGIEDPSDYAAHDYWQGEDGLIGSWSASNACAKVTVSLPNGEFTVMQKNGRYAGITENAGPFPLKYVVSYGMNYFVFNIAYTVKVAGSGDDDLPNPDDNFDIAATIPVVMQIKPSAAYYGDESDEVKALMQKNLDLEYIKTLVGEGTYEFYGVTNKGTVATGTGYTPNAGFTSGFWMGMPADEFTNTVYTSNWGTNSFGIEWNLDDAIIGFAQIPNQRAVGDNYEATFYWVNEDNNKAIKYVFNVIYVEEFEAVTEIVIADEQTAAVTDAMWNEDGLLSYIVDTEKLYTALGLTDELLESVTFSAAQSALLYNAIDPGTDVVFAANGYTTEEESEMAVVSSINIDGGLNIIVDPLMIPFEKGDESTAKVTYAIDYDGKRALLTLVLVSEDSPLTSIEGTTSAAVPVAFYNAAGINVAAPQKGLNIIQMSDGSTKKVLY